MSLFTLKMPFTGFLQPCTVRSIPLTVPCDILVLALQFSSVSFATTSITTSGFGLSPVCIAQHSSFHIFHTMTPPSVFVSLIAHHRCYSCCAYSASCSTAFPPAIPIIASNTPLPLSMHSQMVFLSILSSFRSYVALLDCCRSLSLCFIILL